jgi:signal transduction histidine kinase
LENYYATVKKLKVTLDSLNHHVVKEDVDLIKEKKKLDVLQQKADSILSNQSTQINKKIDAFTFKTFDYDNILKSVSVDSLVTNDSIARKGFLSRILDAISGKYNVKKEKLKIVISYKYLNEIKSGDVKNQIKNLLKTSNDYYKNEIEKSRASFFISNSKDLNLFNLNNSLLDKSVDLIHSFNESINYLQDSLQKQFKDTHKASVQKRNYIIFFLVLLMLTFTILLMYFTRMAFRFENQLLLAQKQILKSLHYKNKIVGMISHEIRSPLSVLAMYSKMISAKVQDLEIKEVFKSMQYTTNNLLVLTSQLLEYSKNEDQKMVLKNTTFDLKDEVDKIVIPLATLAENKGNTLKVTVDIPEHYKVNSDPVRINQLFYNVVGNAIKFTENGTVHIDVRTEKKSNKDLNFLVTVQDNGLGISETDLEHIFEEHYQGDASKSVSELGIGLGMKLCKEIVELFHGSISVESKLREGTKVSFNIVMKLQ